MFDNVFYKTLFLQRPAKAAHARAGTMLWLPGQETVVYTQA